MLKAKTNAPFFTPNFESASRSKTGYAIVANHNEVIEGHRGLKTSAGHGTRQPQDLYGDTVPFKQPLMNVFRSYPVSPFVFASALQLFIFNC